MSDETILAFLAHTRQLLDYVEHGALPFTDEAAEELMYGDGDQE